MTGRRIRQIRRALGLTQEQLAQVMDVHAITISRWENDVLYPSPLQVQYLQAFYRTHRKKPELSKEAQDLIKAGAIIAGVALLLTVPASAGWG